MDIEQKIAKANYTATEMDVEQLAMAHLDSALRQERTDGTYLRILVSAMQAQFGKPPKTRKSSTLSTHERDAHSVFLADRHTALYKAVLRGVTTEDIEDTNGLKPEERRRRSLARNSRAGFARSAASTLQLFIKSGGDVRTLDVHAVTKGALRKLARQAAGQPEETAPTIEPALKRIEKQASALIQADPDRGREAVEECIRRLQALLDAPQEDQTTTRTLTEIETGIVPRSRGNPARERRAN